MKDLSKIDKKEDLFVVGYPRSGNTYLSRLLGDLLISPVQARFPREAIADEGFDRPGKYIIRQEHLDSESYKDEQPVILIVRDPRDVAVSAWKYWNRSSLQDTLHCMGKGIFPLRHGGGWSSFYSYWIDNRYSDIMIHFEELVDDPESELMWIVDGLGLQIGNSLKDVVHRQSMDERKKIAALHGDEMPHGKNVQVSTLRKGVSGDWKNHFSRDDQKLAFEYFGDIAKRMGYDLNVR